MRESDASVVRAMRGGARRAVLSAPVREEGRRDRDGRREKTHSAVHSAAAARRRGRSPAPSARSGAEATAEGAERAATGRAARGGAAARSLRGADRVEAGGGGRIEWLVCLRTNNRIGAFASGVEQRVLLRHDPRSVVRRLEANAAASIAQIPLSLPT